MQGQRLIKEPGEEDFLYRISQTPGAYGTANGKDYYATTPNGLFGNLSNHKIIEHEDGTITVRPSILVIGGDSASDPRWHGFLERGIWREC